MKKTKLIIDIPEEVYKKLLEEQHLPKDLDVEYLIMNGTPLEEELEKIKAEIKEYCEWCDNAHYQSTKGIMLIFDKRIKELKGE